MTTQETMLEFLAPIMGGSRKDLCLCAMHFLSLRGTSGVTVTELKAALVTGRIPKAKQFNVADVLGKAGPLVHAAHNGRINVWSLTPSGNQYVSGLLGVDFGRPDVKNATDGLGLVAQGVLDEVVRGYIEESLSCYRVDARRATVVFLWSGAIRHLQEQAIGLDASALNAALRKHDPSVKQISKVEDFSSVKDTTQLLGFRELGMLDKGQWQTLQEGLSLRNRCGHPTKYWPGISKVASFIEDIVHIVF